MTDSTPSKFFDSAPVRCLFGLLSCAAVMVMPWLFSAAWKTMRHVQPTGTTTAAVIADLGDMLTTLAWLLIGCFALANVAGWSLDAALEGPGNASRRWFKRMPHRN